MNTDTDILIDEKIRNITKEPSMYKVLALNDDVTPIDWVIDLLVTVFRHSEASAKDLTLTIHNEGSAVVGVYTWEIAEQKTVEAIFASRDRGFPLQFVTEVDE
jgi:ATP-dependent Clp protease adaptor protein ClpS